MFYLADFWWCLQSTSKLWITQPLKNREESRGLIWGKKLDPEEEKYKVAQSENMLKTSI